MKRLAHRNPTVQLYALSLSESLGKNLGIDIHREIASRAFTQGLEKLITDRVSNAYSYGFQLSPDMTLILEEYS
jgi:signal transducing adaptor molecule